MFDQLTGLGYGVISFAIVIGVGTIVLQKFGGAVANCPDVGVSTYVYNGNGSLTDQCINVTSNLDGAYDPTNTPWVNTNYLNTQLGTTGLAGWTPAIIALSVGMLFLGVFMARSGRRV